MTQPSLELFFSSGGGGRSVTWRNQPLGSTVSGTIEAVHPPQQVTDPADGKPKFKKNGDPIMQVRVDLQTGFRNWELCKRPDDPNEVDDGRRSLYVGGWMTGAIGDALVKARRQGPPEIGAKLTVTLTERTPNDNPALNPTNKFSAEYVSPSANATGEFFSGGGQPAAAPAAEPLPQKPASISQDAWNQMPDATKRQVAQTMSAVATSDSAPF